ncbi:Krr1-domain-containing protein [Pluteus cervinus]|uniref:Krr1-domain-containing protein n=1 Tax=Pluteus cervinus TaxID=181527 RepID=A0ACD3BAL7_9AGAR|nr:Krr1-domain-containing protein [Pluteus cervinus]
MLSDSDSASDAENLHELTVNEHYAKAFQYKKEREELQKLKEKYGSDYELSDEEDETDSESDETEDEDGEELTPAVDAAILRTLARIKRKDPGIYENGKGVFQEEQAKVQNFEGPKGASKRKDGDKPVTLRQLNLANAISPASSRSPSPAPLPHVEEQKLLRKETISAFHQAIDSKGSDNEDDDDLLILREKTKDEIEREEEEYRQYLEREVGSDLDELVTVEPISEPAKQDNVGADGEEEGEEDRDKKKKKKKKKKGKEKEVIAESSGGPVKKKTKEEEDHEFLMNYILNRGWIDKASKHVPTYREVTTASTSDKKKAKGKATLKEGDLDVQTEENGELPTADPDIDEDDFEEIVDRFETSYNFRFEEPDGTQIATFPRILPSTVRREDPKRKEARARRKERKEEELVKKREEVKRLKNLKMKELRTKLEKIGREGGKSFETDPVLKEIDLEGDWDPESHDRQMEELYGGDYNQEDDERVEKPTWDDDIDITDIIPQAESSSSMTKKDKKKKKKKKKEGQAEDGVDVDKMDADVERDWDEEGEEWDGTEEMRKRKVEEYMDEIFGLEFNDMVGGMPTRFKYVPVPSQTFSLSASDILTATDQELNEYMSIKKYAPYRKESSWNQKRSDKLKDFKDKLNERLHASGWDLGGGEGSGTRDGGGEDAKKKKRKGKKERMKLKGITEGEGEGVEAGTTVVDNEAKDEAAGVGDKRKREGHAEVTGDGNGDAAEEHHKKRKRRKQKNAPVDAS